METRKMIVGMVMVVLVLMGGAAQGTQYYVSPDGNDSLSGTSWATAFETIGKGITTASNGDIIDVNEGTYYETIDYGGKAIKVRSTDPNDWGVVAATIIDANNASTDAVTFDSGEDANSILRGLTVTGATVGVYADSVGPVISRCILHGSRTGVKYTQNSTGTLVVNNKIYDCNGYGVFGHKGDATIKNNWIYDSDKGIKLSSGASADIYNNTIVNNISYGIDKGGGGGTATISNCIIWDCNDDLEGCSATFSCISDCNDASGTGNICGDDNDPLFFDADNNDYRTMSHSPVVDAGDPNYQAGSGERDIDRKTRIQGLRIDAGGSEQPIFVDGDAEGDNDGSSWEDAYQTLQAALNHTGLKDGDEIWVAGGVYKPYEGGDPGSNRDKSFELVAGVIIKGGYGGLMFSDPVLRNTRDYRVYESILSGDIDGDGLVDGENSYHVVKGAHEAVIDGFTITAGNAESPEYVGGGIYSDGGWPPSRITLRNSIIKGNKAERYGAGMYNEYFRPTIENCFFVDNTGGGTGGVFDQGGDSTLINCVFSGNEATATGVGGKGGAIRTVSSSVTLTNCTFSNNSAGYLCGGAYVDEDAVVTNCIFWGNSDSTGNGESAQLSIGGTATVTYNCIQGLDGFSGNNNIGDDPGEEPFFRDESDPNGIDGIFGTLDDGLIMWGDSPCIDSGSNTAAAGITEDITGFPRFVDGDKDTDRTAIVDMGAYEFQRPYFLNISGGEYHTLLLQADGTVWGCGRNSSGQLGLGNTQGPKRKIEQALGGDMGTTNLERIVGIDAGYYHSLAVDMDCLVWAWGTNSHGQIGDDDSAQDAVETTPVEVNDTGGSNPLTDIHGISAGRSGEYSLAFDGSGHGWGWGYNNQGQLGDGTTGTDRYTPRQVVGEGGAGNLENIIDIDAGIDHSIALDDSGYVWCWGNDSSGQLGNGDPKSDSDEPVKVVGTGGTGDLNDIVDVAVTSNSSGSSYALDANGCVWAWGEGGSGQLGQGSVDKGDKTTPVKVKDKDGVGFLRDIVAISAGNSHALALDSYGNVWAWGNNGTYQLGDGTSDTRYTPVQVKKINADYGYLTDIIYIDAGYIHSTAIDIDNNFWVWGSNGDGRLGLGPDIPGSQKYAQIMPSEDPPANNDCDDATTAVLNEVYFGTTVLATDANVWYKFTAPSSTTVNFSLCGSNYDTNLKLWDACGGTKLAENEDSDDCGSGSWQSYLSYSVTADTTYYIAVAGYLGETGNYIFKITE